MALSEIVRAARDADLSVLKDPFALRHVESIWVRFSKDYKDRWKASGSIDFENGPTKGEQEFEAETIEDVLAQMQAFLTSLKEDQTP